MDVKQTKPPPSDIVRFGGGAILAIVALLSVFGVLMAIGDVVRWARADTLIATEALVTRTVIDENTGTSDSVRYRPIVTFEYQVDGQSYTEDNGRVADVMTRAEAEAFIAEHKRGSTITVWYEPNDHDDAYLDNDPPALRVSTVAFLVPALGLAFYFGGWLIPAWRKNRQAAKSAT